MLDSFRKNIAVNTDSYKASMFLQYPPGTETVYSYIESRGGVYDETVFFGLQAYIKEYLLEPVTAEQVEFAKEVWTSHGEPFNYEGWMYIVNELGGKLPISIKAVPEGLVIPTKNVLAVIENTDPKCFWLTTWIETSLLRAVWYPTTVATQSRSIKKVIQGYLEETGDPAGLPFKLHDFGARGVSSLESAVLGGMAHIVNFMGSDTISGVLGARVYYGEQMGAFSIPAAEHSTITSWGRENEALAYKNMLDKFAKPGSIVAVVSDSYNILNACDIWGTTLKQQVIDSGALVVVRPDSGHPETVVLDVVRRLDSHYGSTVNAKGFKVLNNIRVIQGDGINEVSIRGILLNLKFAGYSADNVAFGMGGALLQIVNRDTQAFAMKCSSVEVRDQELDTTRWVDVYKDPVGDTSKKSKRGRVTLTLEGGEYKSGVEDWMEPVLKEVYRNGELLIDYTFAEVRANSTK